MSRAALHPVRPDEAGLRLDRWFKRHYPHLTHAWLSRLVRTGQVRIDGARAATGQRLAAGQQIRVPPHRVPPLDQAPAPPRAEEPCTVGEGQARVLRARLLHRDAAVLVLDKPSGLAVQGGTKTEHHLDAMLDALRFEAAERPRLVHRLDRDTSGVLVLGRTATAAARLAEAFRRKDALKLYWAIVVGVPEPREGRIDLPLSKRGGARGERTVVDEQGKSARTDYRVIDAAGSRVAWVALWPRTGRTHQIRAHLAALGTPILGDGKYGGRAALLPGDIAAPGLHLHARAIDLPQPSGGRLRVVAPLPEHMRRTFARLGFEEALGREPMATAP
ncbi:MAG: RluA family pseudouridine synthase [Alphaproteobacteria bacterium]|nr:RluA family pseudouridine synthase [Alphaproteobacteria bacterium]